MRLLSFSLIIYLLLPFCLSGQSDSGIVTQGDLSAESLVEDIFADGVCETITNIRAIGDPRGIGYFENGSSSIGLDRGIILATGSIENAAGPNEATDRHDDFEYSFDDPDLGLLADTVIYDAVGLEFDFVPLDSIIAFRYVFASEEYCEFVGSLYNDVFGFFVSGPGIEGEFNLNGINAAVVPGTGDYVSINTINYQNNRQYYVGNELGPNLVQCQLEEVESPFLSYIEYDGFTTILTAVLRLQPCETYKLRMLVADVNDGLYDSAVFLEAGSFNIGQKISLSSEGIDGSNNMTYEGCSDGKVIFSRPEDRTDFPVTVNYRIGTSSTAEVGRDYQTLPGSITIPAGEQTAELLLKSIVDDETEGPESVWIVLDIPCACYSDSIQLIITEPPLLEVEAPDAFRCPGTPTALRASAEGGVPPFRFEWSTGQFGPTVQLENNNLTTATVSVTDACRQEVIREVEVRLTTPPSASLRDDTFSICRGDTAFLPLQLQGNPPFWLQYQVNGGPEQEIRFEASDSYLWPVSGLGSYRLLRVRDAGCAGSADGSVFVRQSNPRIEAAITSTTCNESQDGSILLTVENGITPYQFAWENRSADTDSLVGLPSGTYAVTMTDAIGCSLVESFEVTSPPPLSMAQVDCSSLRNGNPRFFVEGGEGPYEFSTDGFEWQSADLFDQLLPGRYYTLFIRDARGCIRAEPDFFFPVSAPEMATLPPSVETRFGRSQFLRPSLKVPPEQIASYRWFPEELFNCPACSATDVSASESQNVGVLITDVFGCKDTLNTLLTVDGRLQLFIPSAFSPNEDGRNDRFTIFADPSQVTAIENIRIFNRWGMLLYRRDFYPTTGSERLGWDGQLNGRPLPTDVYIYTMEVVLPNGKREAVKGDVLLLR